MTGRRMGIAVWGAVGWLALVVGTAALADLLPLADPRDTRAGRPLAGPSISHLFGTDQLGRDLLARTVYGARVSLVVAVFVTAAVVVIGGVIGLVAGSRRDRMVDHVATLAADVLLAMPALLLAAAIVALRRDRGVLTVTAAIIVIYLGPAIRVARAQAVNLATADFVLAARALGAHTTRIVLREIAPNLAPTVAAFIPIAAGGAIAAEGGLAYLNLSVAPPTPTWGSMIAAGVARLDDSWYPTIAPCGALLLTLVAIAIIGDWVHARL